MKEHLVITVKRSGSARPEVSGLEPAAAFELFWATKAEQKRVYPQVELTGWHAPETEEVLPLNAFFTENEDAKTLIVVTPDHVYAQTEGEALTVYKSEKSAKAKAARKAKKSKKKDKKTKKKKKK